VTPLELADRRMRLQMQVERSKGSRALVLHTQQETANSLRVAKESLEFLQHEDDLARACAQRGREHVRTSLVPFVTQALQMVKGQGYEFDFDFTFRRDSFETDLRASNGARWGDPRRSFGGGVCDLVANSLLLAYLLAYRPGLRRFALLDERWPNLGKHDVPAVAKFLRYLVRQQGFQLVLISHQDEFYGCADLVHHISQANGQSYALSEHAEQEPAVAILPRGL